MKTNQTSTNIMTNSCRNGQLKSGKKQNKRNKICGLNWINTNNNKLSKPKNWQLYRCKLIIGTINNKLESNEKRLTTEMLTKVPSTKLRKDIFKQIKEKSVKFLSKNVCKMKKRKQLTSLIHKNKNI